jgi:hypothetical protein
MGRGLFRVPVFGRGRSHCTKGYDGWLWKLDRTCSGLIDLISCTKTKPNDLESLRPAAVSPTALNTRLLVLDIVLTEYILKVDMYVLYKVQCIMHIIEGPRARAVVSTSLVQLHRGPGKVVMVSGEILSLSLFTSCHWGEKRTEMSSAIGLLCTSCNVHAYS